MVRARRVEIQHKSSRTTVLEESPAQSFLEGRGLGFLCSWQTCNGQSCQSVGLIILIVNNFPFPLVEGLQRQGPPQYVSVLTSLRQQGLQSVRQNIDSGNTPADRVFGIQKDSKLYHECNTMNPSCTLRAVRMRRHEGAEPGCRVSLTHPSFTHRAVSMRLHEGVSLGVGYH